MGYNDWRERAEGKSQNATKGAAYYEGESAPLPPKPDPAWDAAVKASERFWREVPDTPMKKLKAAVALLALYDRDIDHTPVYAERVGWLKASVGQALRHADPAQVLGEPRVRELVMTWWGDAAIRRLQERARARAGVAA